MRLQSHELRELIKNGSPALGIKAKRPNRSNTGKPFEAEIKAICEMYARLGIATIEKVDPPTKIVDGKIIFLPNPFLDFMGVWEGRSVTFEAKSTEEKQNLPFCRISKGKSAKVGLTCEQWAAMERWEKAGSIVFLLWKCGKEIRLFTPSLIRAATHQCKDKSIPFIGELVERDGAFPNAFLRTYRKAQPVSNIEHFPHRPTRPINHANGTISLHPEPPGRIRFDKKLQVVYIEQFKSDDSPEIDDVVTVPVHQWPGVRNRIDGLVKQG